MRGTDGQDRQYLQDRQASGLSRWLLYLRAIPGGDVRATRTNDRRVLYGIGGRISSIDDALGT